MVNPVRLARLEDFEVALRDYHVSEHARRILADIQLVILLGVFGGGRNSMINTLVGTGAYHFIVSDTTRPPKLRDGRLEQNGVQYYFRSEEQVLSDIQRGEYLEAELIHNQQVSGISIRELEKARLSGKIAINEIDIKGAFTVKHNKPDATMIFVVPPSYEEWIRRIKMREVTTDEEFQNRMSTARTILKTVIANDIFSFVLNDNLNDAAARVNELVRQGSHSAQHNEQAKRVAVELLKQVDAYFAT